LEKSNRPPTLGEKNQTDLSGTNEDLIALIRRRAENLYKTHQLLCSEAVFFVLNQGLGGGLPQEAAIRLASGFTEGIGGSGCVCGGLSGALMALGLFLGRRRLNGRGLTKIQAKGRELHDLFRSRFGATCCRVLTKKVRHNQKTLFKECATRTGEAAEMAARLILEQRPDLLKQADWGFLTARDSTLGAGLNRLLTLVRP
jgi:C_GCAxxG_C_C family probable redox protein